MTPRFFLMIPEQLNGYDLVASQSLSSTDKLVFEEIFTILNQNRSFFMSNNTLAGRLGVSPSSIKHSIKHLKDQYLISTTMKTKGHLIKGRIISLWGGSNTNHRGSHMNEGGSNKNGGGSHMNPNISSNISINKTSAHQKMIEQELLTDFPRYYQGEPKTRKLINTVEMWLRKYSYHQIQMAIDQTNRYQMKGNYICPPKYIVTAIKRNAQRQQTNDNFVDSTDVDMNKRAELQTKRAKRRLLKKEGKLK